VISPLKPKYLKPYLFADYDKQITSVPQLPISAINQKFDSHLKSTDNVNISAFPLTLDYISEY